MIKEIHLKSFGQFDDLKLQFISGINLIYAENEGGKTTLFSALEAGLLGFIPAGQSYPYFPWEGEELSLELRLEDDTRVQRKMKGSISGYLYEGKQVTSIANQPILGLSREYLRNFHLLQAEDLLELEKNSMDQVIEKHLESIYSGGGTSPKLMLKTLEEKRTQIYKKRGSNYLLYGVEEDLSQLQKDLCAYEEKRLSLEDKKNTLTALQEQHRELRNTPSDFLYPEYLSELSSTDLSHARELEKKERSLLERKEELDQALLQEKSLLSDAYQEKTQKAYALHSKKTDLAEKITGQRKELEFLEEEIYQSLGFRSLSLDHLAKLKLYSYYGSLVTMLLSLLLGGIGWLLKKPEFFAPLLPLLLLFYFFFQSWKKQLLKAKIPGFFHSPKALEKALSLNEDRFKLEQEVAFLERDQEGMVEMEQALLLDLGREDLGGVEEVFREQELASLRFAEILKEKEEIRGQLQELSSKWVLLGPGIGAYRKVGLDQLEEELLRKQQPLGAQNEHEKSTEKIAKLKFEIEALEQELLHVPQGEEELLNEKQMSHGGVPCRAAPRHRRLPLQPLSLLRLEPGGRLPRAPVAGDPGERREAAFHTPARPQAGAALPFGGGQPLLPSDGKTAADRRGASRCFPRERVRLLLRAG